MKKHTSSINPQFEAALQQFSTFFVDKGKDDTAGY
jgi:hypothetical protein